VADTCCEGPHVKPCGPTGDDCFCACGCSGLDERCWVPYEVDDEFKPYFESVELTPEQIEEIRQRPPIMIPKRSIGD
jgi:hypothetical protein